MKELNICPECGIEIPYHHHNCTYEQPDWIQKIEEREGVKQVPTDIPDEYDLLTRPKTKQDIQPKAQKERPIKVIYNPNGFSSFYFNEPAKSGKGKQIDNEKLAEAKGKISDSFFDALKKDWPVISVDHAHKDTTDVIGYLIHTYKHPILPSTHERLQRARREIFQYQCSEALSSVSDRLKSIGEYNNRISPFNSEGHYTENGNVRHFRMEEADCVKDIINRLHKEYHCTFHTIDKDFHKTFYITLKSARKLTYKDRDITHDHPTDNCTI